MYKKPIKTKRMNRRLKEPFLKRAKKAFLRFSRFIIAALILPALVWGGYEGYTALTTTERLSIETIKITGANRVPEEDIYDLAGIDEGDNILSFKADAVAEDLKKNPWIKEARVSRSLPATVNIEITEREPLALVKLDAIYVMDSTGVVFKRYSSEDALDLPVITGLTVDGLKNDGGALEEGMLRLVKTLKGRQGFNLADVSEIHADGIFGLSVYTLNEGVRLELGMKDFEAKLGAFERIMKTRGGSLNGIEAMDLNNYREVVVKFTANAVKEGGEAHGKEG